MGKDFEINSSKKKLKVVDLFSGCGGFSYGFELAGFHVVLGVDNDKAALETFKANHKNSKILLADLHYDKTIEEIVIEKLEKKGITKKSKFHVYDYLYKTIVDMMKDYEEKLQERDCKC